ncbi:exopolysaccharide biosynthesis protein [Microbaculum marinum]|uniref:Exopolysaccharide biosynthesis protein n=1 Tax=Microbaculum marinum TaxID=1764581 RepID=A0AAW9RS93_9HYPH
MTATDAVLPRLRRRARPRPGPRLSRVLRQITRTAGDGRVSLEDLLVAFGDRAFGALLLLFALPNIVPLPLIGVSTVLGIPMAFVAAQMAAGSRTLWLPGWIGRRSVAAGEFRAVMGPLIPTVARAERLLSPRWLWLTSPGAMRAVGVVCLVLSVILLLPIPFANLLPATAIVVLALGLLQKDGLAVLTGLLIAAIAATVAAGVVYAIVKTAIFLLFRIVLR